MATDHRSPAGPLTGLWSALSWLTVLPLPQPQHAWNRRTGGAAIAAVPVVGLLLGITAAAAAFGLAHTSVPSTVIGVLLVALLALSTRGMHLDGLADTVDGLGCYGDPERVRAVMRSGDVGPFGAAALVLVLVLQALCLAALVAAHRWYAVVLAVLIGRVMVVLACRRGLSPANPDGFGALVAGTQRFSIAVWCGFTAAAALAAGWLDAPIAPAAFAPAPAVTALAALAAACAGTWLLTRHCARRLGGITGDVLGAVIELSTAAALVILLV